MHAKAKAQTKTVLLDRWLAHNVYKSPVLISVRSRSVTFSSKIHCNAKDMLPHAGENLKFHFQHVYYMSMVHDRVRGVVVLAKVPWSCPCVAVVVGAQCHKYTGQHTFV